MPTTTPAAEHPDLVVARGGEPEELVQRALAALVIVQRPRVIRERCIGCGICEYKCPVSGEAALRVYVA